MTLKLSTATRGGGLVTKIDRGPGVPIIKMTPYGQIYSRGAQCITTDTSTDCIKLGVPSGKCQRGEFVYLLWNMPIQIFFHNFRGLKWIPL